MKININYIALLQFYSSSLIGLQNKNNIVLRLLLRVILSDRETTMEKVENFHPDVDDQNEIFYIPAC